MTENLPSDPQQALSAVQEIVRRVVPDARCELKDYQHRIGCGVLDRWDNLQEVVFLRRNLDTKSVETYANVLAAKVQTGGSSAGIPPLDEDEERDREREEQERIANRNPTTGY